MSKNLRSIKAGLIRMHGSICQKCNHHFYQLDLTVHHIIPRAITTGINEIPFDKVLLCRACHVLVHKVLCKGSSLWNTIAKAVRVIVNSIKKELRKNHFENLIRDLTTKTVK